MLLLASQDTLAEFFVGCLLVGSLLWASMPRH